MATVDILLPGYSFGTDSGTPAFCAVILVESEGRRILVDTAHVGRRVALQEALAKRGLSAADIDAIFMTHAHWDHVQNFDAFPEVPMAIHSWERQYASRPHVNDWATPQWTGAAIETHPMQEVSEGDELAKGVKVIHLPGHSPGSIGLLVETEAGIAGLTGDAMHTAAVGVAGRSPLVFYSESQAAESITRVMSESDLLYPGHDRPFRMVGGSPEYIEEYKLTLSGVQPGMAGLDFAEPPKAMPPTWVMPGIEDQPAFD